MGIELNSGQIYGCMDLEHWWHHSTKQVFNVAGGAGTGKTTFIRYFIDKIGLKYDEVLFMAYMGKAATQMARNGLPAKTLHSGMYNFEFQNVYDDDGNLVLNGKGKPKQKITKVLKESLGKKIKLIVIDEAGQVEIGMCKDAMSFGVPIIALGDLNQLPPIFGNPYFLQKPDVLLTQVMRQSEGNPIIWLANQILDYKPLQAGVYGTSAVIHKSDLTGYHIKDANMIITCTNKLRYSLNNFMRERIIGYSNLDIPHIGERVICKKNNWGKCIEDGIYLTNGISGTIDGLDKSSYNSRSMIMDFHPDFTKKSFRHVEFDFQHMFADPTVQNDEGFSLLDKFEFAYAITIYASQGSQYPKVLFMDDNKSRDKEMKKKIAYTAVTRASESLVYVLQD